VHLRIGAITKNISEEERNMLLVNASAEPSKLHGIGLIAREFIPRGTIIWVLKPNFDLLLSYKNLLSLSPVSQKQVLHYSYYDEKLMKYILSADDDRFTNHSDNPNTKDAGDHSIDVRDIRSGEEITADYVEVGTTQFKGNGGTR
jgi:hypothetical protein